MNEDSANEKSGVTIWFTGFPCSGKSTVAAIVARELRACRRKVELLDGDVVRTNLSKGLGYGKEDRDENIRRIGFVCHLLSRNGVVAIAAAISPFRAVRDEVRRMTGSFLEIYVKCPLEVCQARDVKGMYKKAIAGEIAQFTGISDPYEEPLAPELTLYTDQEPAEESAGRVLRLLRGAGHV
ncbi:MAG: adenylyl-sulfate kinase [Acidobacteriota bacterium]|nr:adenylyl-sulfate kinase [Acidobacteriota bacterium]